MLLLYRIHGVLIEVIDKVDKELDEEEEVVTTVLLRIPRVSMALEPDIQNFHFHDVELCELLQSLGAPNLLEVVNETVRTRRLYGERGQNYFTRSSSADVLASSMSYYSRGFGTGELCGTGPACMIEGGTPCMLIIFSCSLAGCTRVKLVSCSLKSCDSGRFRAARYGSPGYAANRYCIPIQSRVGDRQYRVVCRD